MVYAIVVLASGLSGAWAQTAELRPAEPMTIGIDVDSNSPSFWMDGVFHVFSSAGRPMLSSGLTPVDVGRGGYINIGAIPEPAWIESVWVDEDELLFLWYHHEVVDVCPGGRQMNSPKIGAAISLDGGRTLIDMGFVLESGEANACNSQNGYFAGGHGDFSVIYDKPSGYFYYFFSNYAGGLESQGVGVARMRFENRFNPVGNVQKYYRGEWFEPGLGGRLTPIFPATAAWQQADADSFWGPSVHWNTQLQQYVILLNRSCCEPGWPQEGVYVTFNPDLANPEGWKTPQKLLDGGEWYPSVLGAGPDGTNTLAGENPRLLMRGHSDWQIVFLPEASDVQEPPE